MSGDTIDLLREALSNGGVSITPDENPEDRAHRHRIESRQACISDAKEIATFCVILLALVAIGGFAAYRGLISPTSDSATQHWCQNVLTAVVTGGISFVLGRSSKGK